MNPESVNPDLTSENQPRSPAYLPKIAIFILKITFPPRRCPFNLRSETAFSVIRTLRAQASAGPVGLLSVVLWNSLWNSPPCGAGYPLRICA